MALVLASLAVYRLATDLAQERGPWSLYERLRGRVMARYGPDDWRSEGICCPICLSFWLGLIVGLILERSAWGLLDGLAIAGAVALVVRVTS